MLSAREVNELLTPEVHFHIRQNNEQAGEGVRGEGGVPVGSLFAGLLLPPTPVSLTTWLGRCCLGEGHGQCSTRPRRRSLLKALGAGGPVKLSGATEKLGEAQERRRVVAGVKEGGGVGSHGQHWGPGGFPFLDFGL